MINVNSVKPALQLTYVKLMMDLIGRGLVMASQVDSEIQQEVAKFPANFTLSMNVFPNGPAFLAKVTENHQLELLTPGSLKADLTITSKPRLFGVFISRKYSTSFCTRPYDCRWRYFVCDSPRTLSE